MTAIRFAGTGGQGVQLAGIVFAEAAVAGGWHAACTQTYGPESRGGPTQADVIISRSEIDFPKAAEVDVLVALSDDGLQRNAPAVREAGIVISEHTKQRVSAAGLTAHALPLVEAARAAGSAKDANIVALGALAGMTGWISLDDLAAALAGRLRDGTARARRALEAGWALGRRIAPS